ncbi:MAG: DUF4129 domain-containing protein [Anaerolineales bacterium]|nr:DUF4129 domain-containing protein [Anaerolineales bacterium]
MNARTWLPAWLPEILVPVLQAGMAGCLAWSLASLASLFLPNWNTPWTVIVAILAALEGGFTFHLFKRRFVFMTDRWQMRVVEFVALFVVVKIGGIVTQPLPPLEDLLRLWTDDLLRIVDIATVVNYIMAVSALLMTTETLEDLDRLSDPERSMMTMVPRDRLYGRFFMGGFLLIVISGLALVGIQDLLNFARPAVTGLVLNALLYFLLGLAQVGVANYMYWAAIWDYEKVEVSGALGARWTWHAVALVGVAALAAFLLPTGYSDGLFSLGRWLIVAIGFVMYLVYLVFYFVFASAAALLSFLLPNLPVDTDTTLAAPPPFSPPPIAENAPVVVDPFWEQLRLVAFGLTIVVMIGVILFLYLRDRPELLKMLRDTRWLRSLFRLLDRLRLRGLGWAQALRQGLAGGLARLRSRAEEGVPFRFWNLRRAAPRDQIFYYYLSILRRAGEQGVRRKPSQTPDEYDPVLGTHVAEAQPDVHELTTAFDQARYSGVPVDAAQAGAVRAAWERLRAALQSKRKPQDPGAA